MRELIERDTSIANAMAAIYVFSSRPAAEFNVTEGVGVVDGEPGEAAEAVVPGEAVVLEGEAVVLCEGVVLEVPVEEDPAAEVEVDKPCMISYVCT